MRLLDRNKQTVYWRNFTGKSVITTQDEYGNTLETGEWEKTYGEVKSTRLYVKSAIGMNSAEPYGDFTSKQRTIYALPQDTDINEYSILWVGINPQVDENGEPTVPHNFTVDGVSHGLNHIRIAIRQVEVNA
jgi:hypothetical protein